MHKSLFLLLFGLVVLALVGCGAAPEPTAYPTYTPYPEPTPYPTYTPYPRPVAVLEDVTDLFCGYNFCIGHPSKAWLTDVEAPDTWSEYESGLLEGLNGVGAYMSIDWMRIRPSEWDSQEQALELANYYQPQGEVRIEPIGPLDVALIAVFDPEDDELPYGYAAAWTCNDRGFRSLIFHERESRPENLTLDALARFTCDQ
ncbi:MAG: hypothetical protein V9H69_03420 [Anaerolineae bacterium]|jgi:hypothetical protein